MYGIQTIETECPECGVLCDMHGTADQMEGDCDSCGYTWTRDLAEEDAERRIAAYEDMRDFG